MAEQAFLNDTILAIVRLTDSHLVHGKTNASLEALIAGLNHNTYDKLTSSLRERFALIQSRAKPLRTRRHKVLAHRDFTAHVSPSENPLPGISRQLIDDCLQDIASFLNVVQRHFGNTTTFFDMMILEDDGHALIHCLKQSVNLEDLVKAEQLDHSYLIEGRYKDA